MLKGMIVSEVTLPAASLALRFPLHVPRGPTSCPGRRSVPRRHTIQFSETEPGPFWSPSGFPPARSSFEKSEGLARFASQELEAPGETPAPLSWWGKPHIPFAGHSPAKTHVPKNRAGRHRVFPCEREAEIMPRFQKGQATKFGDVTFF